MPHIAITMIPGRDMETKQALAEKVQMFIASELEIENKFVSVSIQDIPIENWDKNMEQFPEDILFIKPGV